MQSIAATKFWWTLNLRSYESDVFENYLVAHAIEYTVDKSLDPVVFRCYVDSDEKFNATVFISLFRGDNYYLKHILN